MKFRTKILTLFICCILVQGGIVGYFSYYYANDKSIQTKKQTIASLVNLIDINLNTKVRFINDSVSSAVENNHIMQDLQISQSTVIDQTIKNFHSYLEQTIGNINAVMLIDENTIHHYSARAHNLSQYPVKMFLAQDFLETAKNTPGKLLWYGIVKPVVGYSDDLEKKILACFGIDSKNVIAIEVNINSFINLIPVVQDLFINQYIFIIDKNHQEVAANKAVGQRWLPYLSEIENNHYQNQLVINEEEYFTTNQLNGLTGWRTVAMVSTKDMIAENAPLKKVVLLFVVTTTVVFSIIVLLISIELTKPLNQLSDAMDNAQQSDYQNILSVNRRDEIGKLGNSFNHLLIKIQQLIREVYLSKITQKNAELSALEAQINPHFLYNSLDSINWMLIENDEEEISEVVVALGNILKYSLNTAISTVTLREELSYIESYLLIQRNRFEERLKYQINISQALMTIEVPKLILQPIVENSVIHGVDAENHKLCIEIILRAYEKDEIVYIEVIDNGVGIPSDKLIELNKKLKSKQNNLNSIGLDNVNRRLKIYFGKEYGLEISNQHSIGTIVTITLPKGGKKSNDEFIDY